MTSNDELYGGEDEFQEAIVTLGAVTLERTLTAIKELGKNKQVREMDQIRNHFV